MRAAPLLWVALTGCCLFAPVSQDPETIRGLLELKPAITGVYGSFKGAALDESGIVALGRKLSALRDREAGKSCNDTMTGQVDRCRAMFEDHLRQRRAGTAWSAAFHDNKVENLLDLVDLAVATERQKPQ